MANDKDFIVKNGIQATGNLTVNTVTAGTWQGTVITGQYGGTGVNNAGKSITIGGNIVTANSFTTANNYALTLTTTAATNVTLPTTGTLATLGGTETLTAKTLTSPTINSGTLSGTFTGSSSINLNVNGTLFSNTLIIVDRGTNTYSDGFSIRSGVAAVGNPALFIRKATATGFNINGWNGTSQEGTLTLTFPSGVSTSADLYVGADLTVTANVGIGSSVPSSTSLLSMSKVLTSDDSTNGTNIYIVDSNTAMTAARTKTGIKSALSITNQNKNADGLTSYTSEYLAGYFPVSHGSSSALDAYASSIRGVRGLVSSYTNATTPTAAAVDAWVYQAGGGNISSAFGVTALVGASNNSVTGTITTAQGVRSVIISNTAMNIGTGYLFWGQHSGSNTTAKYGVYVTGEANNYFSGNLTVGGTTSITGNTSFGANTAYVDTVTGISTGGTGVLVLGANAAYQTRYTDGTGAGSTSYSSLQVYGTGATAGLRATFLNHSTNNIGARVQLGKSRGTPVGTNVIVNSGDTLGDLQFIGADGAEYIIGSSIASIVEGTPAANNVAAAIRFRTANTGSGSTLYDRMNISSNGNIGINTNSPTSTLQVAGTANVSGNTVIGGNLNVNGTITISTGDIVSGTYTPTVTIVTNVNTATVATTFNYMRVGSVVTVSGVLNANVNTINSDSTVAISLPIASNFANGFEGSGLAAPTTAAFAAENGVVIADATNDRMSINFRSTTTASKAYAVNFTYRII